MEKTPSEKQEMTIKIQTLDSSFPITLPTTSTVQQLKDIISSKYTIPQINQRLIFQGKFMQNQNTLSSYKITDECVIHLVAKSLEENQPNQNQNNQNQNNQNSNNQNTQNQNNNNPHPQYLSVTAFLVYLATLTSLISGIIYVVQNRKAFLEEKK